MSKVILDRSEFRDKVFACWLGKNIGGTLGAPIECQKYTHELTFFDPVPDGSAPNDDLDLQLVWLVMLEKEGLPPRLPWFAEYWKKFLHKYPWNEYGFCSRNLKRGLMPPVSGWFENYYVDEMGSPIRSELWACVAPADPQTAAAFAWMDSALDHAGGEGTYGEMFWAAVESAAFVVKEPMDLIRIGLAMIPPACNISRAVRESVWCRQNGVRLDDARERIVAIYGNEQPCNAIANHGFTILGWLYGEDFGDRLCKAVNCGYDTDCTGATLGSLLGIIEGSTGIPSKWSDPIGLDIVLLEFTGDCGVPRTLDELTDRTVALAERFMKPGHTHVSLGDAAVSPDGLLDVLYSDGKAVAALGQDIRCGIALDGELEILFHYNGDPVLRPGVGKRVHITCRRDGMEVEAVVGLAGPEGCSIQQVADALPGTFKLNSLSVDGPVEIKVSADLDGKTYGASFVLLSPDQAQGYPNAAQATEWSPGMRLRSHSPKRPGAWFEKV
jgi:ADP-ribosylglycohydrolase